MLVLALLLSGWFVVGGVEAGTSTDFLKTAQSSYERKQYAEALDALDHLSKEGALSADVLRLKTKILLKLGRPKDALKEYEQLESTLKRDDRVLLREVAVGFLTVLLKDMREQMRGAAYTALKELDPREAVPYFEDGLSDGSGLVRALVVEGLGMTEEGRRSPRLRRALDDQAGMVRAAALKVLSKTKDQSVLPLLEQGLKDEQAVVRLASAGGLVFMNRPTYWEQIRQTASTKGPKNSEERATALRLLGELKDSRGLPVLLEAVGDSQPSVRGAAATALGELKKAEALAALQKMLGDAVPAVRTSAAIGLGELGDKRAIPSLKDALADINLVVQASVISALLRLDEPFATIAPAVRGLSQQPDPGVRSAVAKALGRAEGKNIDQVVGFLELMLKDPVPRPRIAAARSLGHVGSHEVVPILKQSLHDDDDAVRATAGGALAHVLGARGHTN